MTMTGVKEGYLKFAPRFEGLVEFPSPLLADLNRWRNRLYQLELVGMYKEGELKGIGFGNVSARSQDGFVITATSTGGLSNLGPGHYAEIVRVDLDRNTVGFRAVSERVLPSSECMTHAMFYKADPGIGGVIHVHHREFWKRLLYKVPTTSPDVTYGTPAMAGEILRLFQASDLPHRKLVVMAGHEEGVIAFGRDLDEAGAILLDAFGA